MAASLVARGSASRQIYVFSESARIAADLVAMVTAMTTSAPEQTQVHVVCLGTAQGAVLAGSGATSVIALVADEPRPEAYAGALARVVGERRGDLLLVGGTTSGQEIAARVATILGCGLVSEATALGSRADGEWSSERIMYAGAAIQSEAWTGPAVVTIAPGQAAGARALAPTEPAGRTGPPPTVESIAVEVDTRVRRVSLSVRDHAAVDLAGASRVVCVGMGLATRADLTLAADLATALGAEMACTRPVAEDREWLPAERYIGISGVRVSPDLYVGVGVSGQVQHTIGIRDAKVVVGINTDPAATLFGVCDYALVGDLHEIVPLLTAAVRARDGQA